MFIIIESIWILLIEVEVIQHYRQSAQNSENVGFSGSVIQTFQSSKIVAMVVVYEKIQSFGMRVVTDDVFQNFKLLINFVSYVTNQYYLQQKTTIINFILIFDMRKVFGKIILLI